MPQKPRPKDRENPSRDKQDRQTRGGTPSSTVDPDTVRAVVEGRAWDPFGILGPHAVSNGKRRGVAIRAIVPGAERMQARVHAPGETGGEGTLVDLRRVDDLGFFECVLETPEVPRYTLRANYPGIDFWEFEDPYRFGPILGEVDIHLLSEGNHLHSYDKLGAHPVQLVDIAGVHFAVWAPNAERVSVVGDFNGWDGRRHPMRSLGASGLWEIFIPGLREGDAYKYEIRTRDGHLRVKSDPCGNLFEYRPGTASIVWDLGKHRWSDGAWLEKRAQTNWHAGPMSIYEVHLGSWRRVPEEGNRFLTYRELAPELVAYVKDMGFTHIELLPLQEHPLDASWGYQATGFFAPTSRYGTPDDLMAFVDECHRNDIGVILDWVPAHFPKDDWGLRYFDGSHLYEHADPRQGEHADWGTLIFNYGRNEVRNFLLSSALFWLDKFHIDGLRVDAVASMLYLDYSKEEGEWIPNRYGGKENLDAIEFLKRLNVECHGRFPGVLTIAEESTAWPSVSRPTYLGGLGFSMKWNMGWMNDTLAYVSTDPIFRKYHHQNLTFSLLYAFTENFILPLSHDEVVHGKCSLLDKMPGDAWQKFANLRVLLGFQYMHPGKKLLFMGGEFGAGSEWTETRSLDWHLLDIEWHAGVQRFVRDLNRLYMSERALWEIDFEWNGFEWIDFQDWEQSVVAFVRRGRTPGDELVVALNFTPAPRSHYRIGVPRPGYYREVLNSDAACYGGSGTGNLGGVHARNEPHHGKPYSLEMTLPPLSIVAFKPV